MDDNNAWNMYVFRDGACTLPTATLVRGLQHATDVAFGASSEPALDLLLRAGELECGLTDAGCEISPATSSEAAILTTGSPGVCASPNLGLRQARSVFWEGNEASRTPHRDTSDPARTLPSFTDAAARRLLSPDAPVPLPNVDLSFVPDRIHVSPAEGFAYYALHPLDFADLASAVPLDAPRAAVVGIRSIGTTLSAVVVAALERRGIPADRVTVRPTGHPYDRRTRFSPEQLRWIAQRRQAGAEFLVVDEGPGMSGSSFLSVGDALVEAGVDRNKIQFLCSRQPDPAHLRARDAASRWPSYRAHYVAKNWRLPTTADLYAGGGQWRGHLYASPDVWPASWVQMERLKFWSADRKTLCRFEGFARYGAEVRERAERVAAAGFGPTPFLHENGFASYPALRGRPLQRSDLDCNLLDLIARYCAFRASELRSRDPQNLEEMETMLRFNLAQEFSVELQSGQNRKTLGGVILSKGSCGVCASPSEGSRANHVEIMGSYTQPLLIGSDVPILADGRMMPWEWILTPEGRIFKTDAADHADDHFFPGPTDIAWDLVGAIVEWDMSRAAADYIVERYSYLSGDNSRPRLPGYRLAYTVFRMAYCKMAAASAAGSGEEHRLLRDYYWYRAKAALLLPQRDLAAAD
jgi:hypothetical protein